MAMENGTAAPRSFTPSNPGNDVVDDASNPKRALIGYPPNHWLYAASPPEFDLTRPAPPDFPRPSPRSSIRLQTTTTPIVIAPALTALVIIDMQNFFLSTALGRRADGAGNRAGRVLVETAIPAARAAGIRIIWLSWGLTDDEIDAMPASTRRAFGFEASLRNKAEEGAALPAVDAHGVNQAAAEHVMRDAHHRSDASEWTTNGTAKRMYQGLGSEMGPVTLDDGSTVDGGRLLMRDTWNAALPPHLEAAYREGRRRASRPDVWMHKNRMSGLWGAATACTAFLEEEGITTLLFGGVNTDQCVAGSLQDAFSKGWDCVLLRDGCGTTSPRFAAEMVEFNCARTWGFVSDGAMLARGVEEMTHA